MSRRRRFLILSGVLAAACLVALWVAFYKDIAVAYHRRRMMSSWYAAKKAGSHGRGHSDYVEACIRHRDALVRLGFFARREFPLRHISVPSLHSRRLWEELLTAFPDHIHAVMQGYEPGTVDMIVVWDRPERMAAWEAVIRAHDRLSRPGTVTDANRLKPFLGTWEEPGDGTCYTISSPSPGVVSIETPPNDTWRDEIKSIRLEGTRLMFDEFHYLIDDTFDLKSPVNPSGAHPFSGIRCQAVLELHPADPEQLTFRFKAATLPDETVATLRRLPAAEPAKAADRSPSTRPTVTR